MKLIRKNNQYNLFFDYSDEGKKLYVTKPKSYLNYLEFITDDGCKPNYKNCGKLDTYGNILCFPKNDECPINDIIIDYPNNKYINNGYSYYIYADTGYYFYYKKGNINGNAIVYWYVQYKSQPKYIDGSNFILDKEAFDEIFSGYDDDDNDIDDDNDYYDDDEDNNDEDNNDNNDDSNKVSEGSSYNKELMHKTIDQA